MGGPGVPPKIGHAWAPVRQRGFSLAELMVALTLGLILLGGLVQIFVSSKQAFRLQEGFGLLQENGRFALETLTRSLQMADHWGAVEADDVVVGGAVLAQLRGRGDCDAAWITQVREGVRGYEGAADIGGVEGFPGNGCIEADEYAADSDILVVRYASPVGMVASADLGRRRNPNNADKLFVRSAVNFRADIRRGADGAPGGEPDRGGIPDGPGVYNFPYRIETYFVRPCSVLTNGACRNGIPTLTRLQLNNSRLVQEPLVENIEQVQIEYGSDTDGDGGADSYDGAAGVSHWANVVSARVSLIARSAERDIAYMDTTTYQMPGAAYTVPVAEQNFRRRQYGKVVQIRNRSRR